MIVKKKGTIMSLEVTFFDNGSGGIRLKTDFELIYQNKQDNTHIFRISKKNCKVIDHSPDPCFTSKSLADFSWLKDYPITEIDFNRHIYCPTWSLDQNGSFTDYNHYQTVEDHPDYVELIFSKKNVKTDE